MANRMNRREWIKRTSAGMAGAAVALSGCSVCPPERLKGEVSVPEQLPVLKAFDVPRLRDRLPRLGISTLSFPRIGKKLDVEEGKRIVQFAAAHGVKLFDTAWAYREGEGERILGDALKDSDRSSYRLSTSMPTWDIKTLAQAKEIFSRQLELLHTSYIDFYSLQAINSLAKFNAVYKQTGVLDFLLRMREEGVIRHLGIDLIGDETVMDELLKSGNITHLEATDVDHESSVDALLNEDAFWDFMRIPYNAEDNRKLNGAPLRMIEKLHRTGLAVFVTNPTKDGALRAMSGDATDILYEANPRQPIAGWALRDAATAEGTDCVIDSVPDMTALKEDVMVFGSPLEFTATEKETWSRAMEAYLTNTLVNCTYCDRCMPCPYGINIPGIFRIYNEVLKEGMVPDRFGDIYSETFSTKGRYFINRYCAAIRDEESAFRCIRCDLCVPKCPELIAIPEQMDHIAAIVETVKDVEVEKICGH